MTRVYYSLYDRMISEERLHKAFLKVKTAKGAAGVDGQTIEDFACDLQKNLEMLLKELRGKSYRPQPVKRVEIPKAGGGKRKLGIPSVRDRVVQQALLEILQPIYDPEFHPSSYGYRPGRSCHQAIAKATMFIRNYERQWVVDMDLTKCFDTLDHDIIIEAFRKRVTDGSILKLLRMFLQSGVMTEEGWQASTEGSPQGGVISPLVANVYLDAFDQYMKSRKQRIVRYADDTLIFTRSKSAAENALKQATRYLEGKLKLTVNQQKTHIVHSSEGVKFLGVVIRTGFTGIQDKKIRAFKEKVKKITRRNSPVNLGKVIADLNPLVRGFANYFRIANCKEVFKELSGWVRRRLRAKQLALWKKPTRLHRRLRQLGYRGEFKAIKMNSWRNAASPLASFAIPNKYLRELGLFDLCSVHTGIPVSV
ncbi:MAG: group II intron reverse transcriptase/maturase [Nitrospirae bacterium]|nr:group II intron reverse transcriptase/maturase [Nitrospirota bacterium]